MEIISTNALISINATFFAQLISFLIFMFALNKVMVSPLRRIAAKRSGYLDDIQNKIDLLKKQMGDTLLELERKKSKTIEDSFSLMGTMEDKANNEATSIYHETRNKITLIQKESDKEIQQQIVELRASLHKDVDGITTLIMEKILDRRLRK